MNLTRAAEKLRSVARIARKTPAPLPLILDSVHLQAVDYVAADRRGVKLLLEPKRGEWFTFYECVVRQDYLQHGIVIRDGDTVVDVGGNIGAFTVLAAHLVGPRGRVLAFEPDPAVFDRLRRNVDLNRLANVELYNEAVGGEDGEAVFFAHPKPAFSSLHEHVDGRDSAGARRIETRVRSIASVMALAGGRVQLLKMDCEGGEYSIFDRMTRAHAVQIDQIAMEAHVVEGRSITELPRRMQALGFDVNADRYPMTAFRRLVVHAAAA